MTPESFRDLARYNERHGAPMKIVDDPRLERRRPVRIEPIRQTVEFRNEHVEPETAEGVKPSKEKKDADR